MSEKVERLMKDVPAIRWAALLLLAFMMFFSYMFMDVLSPMLSLLQTTRGWTPDNYGTFTSAEYFLNVFAFFLIFAGIILDKIGVRKTAVLSALIMFFGASIKYYAITDAFQTTGLAAWLSSWWPSMPASAKLASLGFMFFGCGVEMASVAVNKGIVKWFKGKELALAMGVEMGLARLGVFAVFFVTPRISAMFATTDPVTGAVTNSLVAPVAFCLILLSIAVLCSLVYFFFDRKLDKQLGESGEEPEDEFKLSDVGKLFASKTFLLVAGLCVLYYSAIFPFQKFAVNMLECRLGITNQVASNIFMLFPVGAMVLTPLLGIFLDKKGKAATMIIAGAVMMFVCHMILAITPKEYFNITIALTAIVILGVSFSLVPAALWPSVSKLVDNRYLGSAFSAIFWVQNIGLMFTPMIIGWSLVKTNPGVTDPTQYSYTVPMLIFASFGVLAFLLSLWLKYEDKKHHYGMQEPNIKK